MAATFKWDTVETPFALGQVATGVSGSNMNALAAGSRAISTGTVSSQITSGVVQNDGGYRYGHIAWQLTHGTNIFASAPAGNGHWALFFMPVIGSLTASGSSSVAPTGDYRYGTMAIPSATLTTYTWVWTGEIPNANFYVLLQNNTNVAVATTLTGFTMNMARFNEKSV